MRPAHLLLVATLTAFLFAGCDFWPRQLGELENALAHQLGGETAAWLLGGDVVIIDIAGATAYGAEAEALEGVASDVARQAIAAAAAPLESVVVTFHEGVVSEDAERQRVFVFLVKDGRPTLQPLVDLGATGPLTPGEIEAALAGK